MVYDDIIYNSIIDEVVNILNDVREEIQQNMSAKGVNASGRTSDGIRVERYDNGVRLVLSGERVAPLATLEVGRRGGKVPTRFADIIEEWSRDKGLQFPRETDRRRFAYLTARKIARQGTVRHKLPVDVYSDAVLKGKNRIRKSVKTILTDYIHENLPK